MEYVIVTIEWCLQHGISVPEHARKSIDGKSVVLHYSFVRPVVNEDEELRIYLHDDAEFINTLSGKEWSSGDETI